MTRTHLARKAALGPTVGPSSSRATSTETDLSRFALHRKRGALKMRASIVNKAPGHRREPTPLARLPLEYDPYDPEVLELRYEILERNLAMLDSIPSFRVVSKLGTHLPPHFTLRRPSAFGTHSARGAGGLLSDPSGGKGSAPRDVPPFPLYGAKITLHLTSECIAHTLETETYEGYLELSRTTQKRGARPKTKERLLVICKLGYEPVDEDNSRLGTCEELLDEYATLVRLSSEAGSHADSDDLGALPLIVGYFAADDGTRRGPIRDCLVVTRPF